MHQMQCYVEFQKNFGSALCTNPTLLGLIQTQITCEPWGLDGICVSIVFSSRWKGDYHGAHRGS